MEFTGAGKSVYIEGMITCKNSTAAHAAAGFIR